MGVKCIDSMIEDHKDVLKKRLRQLKRYIYLHTLFLALCLVWAVVGLYGLWGVEKLPLWWVMLIPAFGNGAIIAISLHFRKKTLILLKDWDSLRWDQDMLQES